MKYIKLFESWQVLTESQELEDKPDISAEPGKSDPVQSQTEEAYATQVFPKTRIKRILYHYTSAKSKILKDGFKSKVELGTRVGDVDMDAIFFTASKENYWGGKDVTMDRIAVVLNIQNPIDLSEVKLGTEEEDLTQAQKETFNLFKELKEKGEDSAWNKYGKGGQTPTSDQIEIEVRKSFEEAGYDAIIYPEFSEVAIFNKQNIKIVDDAGLASVTP
jgi:hypothetical protein